MVEENACEKNGRADSKRQRRARNAPVNAASLEAGGTGGTIDWSSRDAKHKELYLQFFLPLKRQVEKLIGGDREAASDIVHEVFLDVIKNNRLEEVENPRAYLYRAARNASASYFRTFESKRFTELDQYEDAYELFPDENAVCAEAKLIRAARSQRLITALAGLKERECQALIGFYVRGKGWKDVAKELGVSISTAKNEARVALTHLKGLLTREG